MGVPVPQAPQVEACQDVERVLLPALAPRLPLPVPVPTRLGRATAAYPFRFLGYRRLAGTPAIALPLDAVDVATCGAQMGEFLTVLHTVPQDEARALAVRDVFDRRSFERWHTSVTARLPSMAHAVPGPLLEATRAFLDRPLPAPFEGPLRLVHYDLRDTHLLVDAARRRLCGVLDWGDVSLGDPALDLAGLLQWQGPSIEAATLAHYRGMPVDRAFLERARAAAVFASFSALRYGLEGRRPDHVRSGLRSLAHTLPAALECAEPFTLTPFTPEDAGVVASWARTPEEVGAWCGRAEARVAPAVVAEWARRSDVRAFVGRASGRPVAYGELWLDADEGEVELAHLIVDPALRRRGLGIALTRALVARARADHPDLADVFLRLRRSNVPALRTYARAGFQPVPDAEAAAWNVGQPEPFAWMRLA